ncbi:MAG: hypothetical protein ACRBHB_21340 [Arenicella sp.]
MPANKSEPNPEEQPEKISIKQTFLNSPDCRPQTLVKPPYNNNYEQTVDHLQQLKQAHFHRQR